MQFHLIRLEFIECRSFDTLTLFKKFYSVARFLIEYMRDLLVSLKSLNFLLKNYFSFSIFFFLFDSFLFFVYFPGVLASFTSSSAYHFRILCNIRIFSEFPPLLISNLQNFHQSVDFACLNMQSDCD